jgi:uncharacterized protein (TIGR01319 family)
VNSYAVCADVGSTYTKVAVVDLASGALAATAQHPTTIGGDVLHGLDAAIAICAAALPGVELTEVYACSSAGGGLRLAVVGYEQLVTARAGHRVGLSAGARVVHVCAGRLDDSGIAALRAARPDVVLLVGGTDGGDAEVLTHNARRLSTARPRVPVVVAGNVEARDEVVAVLTGRGVAVVATENVLPRIGTLNPRPARAAIREVFLRHVIGGKKLSRGPRFAALVHGATPDLVLTGVELLADELGSDLVVIDIGGATTDVYSVLTPDAERESGPRRAVAGTLWRSRTVEGDLGMRWSATGVVEAAVAERLVEPAERDVLAAAAARRAAEPGYLPGDGAEQVLEGRFAALAATVALRRHARGQDLREVALLVGSGGVLRYASAEQARSVLDVALHDHAGGWALPRAAQPVVDVDYVLAAAGLLAGEHRASAVGLLRSRLLSAPTISL